LRTTERLRETPRMHSFPLRALIRIQTAATISVSTAAAATT